MRIRHVRRALAAVLAALVVGVPVAGCAAPTASPVTASAERDGLALSVQISADSSSIDVAVQVRNGRADAVHLVPDQCGRITDAILARTRFEPEGATWNGSIQSLKELVLDDQRSLQRADRFHPRLPGTDSSDVPPCSRPERPVELLPGQELAERKELPLSFASALDAAGSAATVVRVELVEARSPTEMEFLDIRPPGGADEERAGRNVRVEVPASAVIQRAAATDDGQPSMGELFDRLLANDGLRSWIEAQPADSWRLAILRTPSPFVAAPETAQVRLRMVTTQFERAAYATARADGTDVAVDLPTDADRARAFSRSAGTTPPGIALIEEPNDYVLGDDLSPGALKLPSGRVAVGEFLFDAPPLDFQVVPGSYPVHATLARYRDFKSDDVALATLVLSDQLTLRWAFAQSIAVDGGSATFTSPEGVALLGGDVGTDPDEWRSRSERIFDSRVSHDYLVTEFGLSPDANLVEFSSGIGDGGYPVYIGYDAAGKPTQVVIDFLLLHLDWPLAPG